MLLQASVNRLPVQRPYWGRNLTACACTLVKVGISGVLIFANTFQHVTGEEMALTRDTGFVFFLKKISGHIKNLQVNTEWFGLEYKSNFIM